ncbi:MAG: GldG family protein [Lachnospiraceae bacterium]|nr:GldG family protein [Lachnospiraceae bacterium]
MKKFLNSFKSRSLRVGGYSVIATVALVLIVILVNVAVAVLPDSVTKFDLSADGIYEISGQSRTIAKNLDMDVTVYWIYAEGKDDPTLENFLNRYVSLSRRLHLKTVDPDENPGFATKYGIEQISDNTLVVESDKRYRYIPHSQIFRTSYQMDETAESGIAMVVTFEGDAVLTSAVSYVVNDVLPVAYRLEGHGESYVDASYTEKVELDNIKLDKLNLATAGAVPDDCDLLMMLNPSSDISDEEYVMIENFLNRGGNFFLITSPTLKEGARDNLLKLMAKYGLTEEKGMVVDPNSNNYLASQNSLYLLPTVNVHAITQPLRQYGYRALLFGASGLRVAEEKPAGVSDIRQLLVSSDDAYAKKEIDLSHLSKDEGDAEGPFCLGALVTKKNEAGKESYIVWYTSASILDPTASAIVSGANENLFLNTVDYMASLEENIGIHGKTITSDYLTVPASEKNLWMVVLIGVIPVLTVVAGIIVTLRRRAR